MSQTLQDVVADMYEADPSLVDRPYAEIAEMAGCSTATVGCGYHVYLDRIRKGNVDKAKSTPFEMGVSLSRPVLLNVRDHTGEKLLGKLVISERGISFRKPNKKVHADSAIDWATLFGFQAGMNGGAK